MKRKNTANIGQTDTHDILPPKGWKPPSKTQSNLAQTDAHDIGGLLASLRKVIHTARQQVLHAVDVVQVRTCWTVGQHIVEFEQGGAARAAYGKRLLAYLAESLVAEFGKGFDASNLRTPVTCTGKSAPFITNPCWSVKIANLGAGKLLQTSPLLRSLMSTDMRVNL